MTGRRSLGLALLALCWLVLAPYLAIQSAIAGVSTNGIPLSRTDRIDALALAYLAVACGVLLPLAGAVIAGFARRGLVAGLFCAGVVLALAASTVLGPVRLPVQVERPFHGGCQEHSGGDTRCPGG